MEKHIPVNNPDFPILSRHYDPTDPDHTIGAIQVFKDHLDQSMEYAVEDGDQAEIDAINAEKALLDSYNEQGYTRIIMC